MVFLPKHFYVLYNKLARRVDGGWRWDSGGVAKQMVKGEATLD